MNKAIVGPENDLGDRANIGHLAAGDFRPVRSNRKTAGGRIAMGETPRPENYQREWPTRQHNGPTIFKK